MKQSSVNIAEPPDINPIARTEVAIDHNTIALPAENPEPVSNPEANEDVTEKHSVAEPHNHLEPCGGEIHKNVVSTAAHHIEEQETRSLDSFADTNEHKSYSSLLSRVSDDFSHWLMPIPAVDPGGS